MFTNKGEGVRKRLLFSDMSEEGERVGETVCVFTDSAGNKFAGGDFLTCLSIKKNFPMRINDWLLYCLSELFCNFCIYLNKQLVK